MLRFPQTEITAWLLPCLEAMAMNLEVSLARRCPAGGSPQGLGEAWFP